MANSMDTILVRYSGSENPVSLREFIYPEKYPDNPPLKLTEEEKKNSRSHPRDL